MFIDNIEKLYEELLTFIKEYESLPDSAPFDLTIFNLLKSEFEEYKEKCGIISLNCENMLTNNQNSFDLVMKKYNADSISLRKAFYNKKKENESETKAKIKQIQDDINSEKANNKNHTIEKEMEIEWAHLSNEQSRELIKDEHKNAISRFDYQREHYRNVYNNSVKDFNSDLKKALDLEDENYEAQKKRI